MKARSMHLNRHFFSRPREVNFGNDKIPLAYEVACDTGRKAALADKRRDVGLERAIRRVLLVPLGNQHFQVRYAASTPPAIALDAVA